MYDNCLGVQDWLNCLNCSLLSTVSCPLEGDDALDRIANRIRMMEDPSYSGFKKTIQY